MKKNKKYMIIGIAAAAAALILVIALVAVNAGKKAEKATDTETAEVESSSETLSLEADLSDLTDEESEKEDDGESSEDDDIVFVTDETDDKEPADSVEDANALDPEYINMDFEEEPGTEETKSEALNTAPGTVVTLSASAREISLGETVSMPQSDPAFSVCVKDIALTDKRSEMQEADRVARITYTYASKSLDNLLIGQYSFRLLDEENRALEIYYFDYANDPEANNAPVGSGQEATAAVGFIVPEGCHTVTLVYDDTTGLSDTQLICKKTLD